MTVFDGLLAVRNIVNSGAKYFAVSSYPPEALDRKALGILGTSRSSVAWRNEEYIQRCQNSDELKRLFCRAGKRVESTGWFYPNVMRCFPFNFPAPILDKPSHETFKIEADHLQVYQVSDLKSVVALYDQSAEFCRTA